MCNAFPVKNILYDAIKPNLKISKILIAIDGKKSTLYNKIEEEYNNEIRPIPVL